jgi:hypothetical protein
MAATRIFWCPGRSHRCGSSVLTTYALFAGVNPSCAGVIGGSLPGAKQHSVSPHFVNAQSSTVDSGPKVDSAVDSSNVVALSCSLTDGFLSLAAWVRSSCVMYHPPFILHLQRFQKVCILMQLKVRLLSSHKCLIQTWQVGRINARNCTGSRACLRATEFGDIASVNPMRLDWQITVII